MEIWDYVGIEAVKTLFGFLTLGVGWLFGEKIVKFWDLRKKRQEIFLETATQFNKLYGEFKEVSRLWRAFCYPDKQHKFPDTLPVELLRRSSAAEGGIEAIIVKLATERDLNQSDIKTLGLFRQAYQKLREAIRGNLELEWTYGTPQYMLYNDLASRTALIISSNGSLKASQHDQAVLNLEKITKIRSDDWEAAVSERESQLKREDV